MELPGCLYIVLLCFLPLLSPDLIERCIGHTPEVPESKGAAAVSSALATLCSPLLFLGNRREILLGITLVALLIAIWWSRRWIREHQAHWDVARANAGWKNGE